MNYISEHYKIIDIVCEIYGTSYRKIITQSKRREYTYPRYTCIHFLRKYTNLTTTKIGLLLGRGHSAVVIAGKVYEDLLLIDIIKKKHNEIENRLTVRNIQYNTDCLIDEYENW
ncbi:MAG: hypothetical protein LBF04_04140 [Prevotellaceae bacterium]|jgi:chromosomal replication initiation ATPase DnaA|nr:hypothetical protein [Prevotellaceae bacterium]